MGRRLRWAALARSHRAARHPAHEIAWARRARMLRCARASRKEPYQLARARPAGRVSQPPPGGRREASLRRETPAHAAGPLRLKPRAWSTAGTHQHLHRNTRAHGVSPAAPCTPRSPARRAACWVTRAPRAPSHTPSGVEREAQQAGARTCCAVAARLTWRPAPTPAGGGLEPRRHRGSWGGGEGGASTPPPQRGALRSAREVCERRR